jgi:hypothetical protein
MTTEEFIIDLFCRVDGSMGAEPKHPQAKLYPSETVTLALLYALKGTTGRAFYRWLTRDFRPLFPALPERTRLFRLLATHRGWADVFLAEPTLLGLVDSYGIELRHPRRHGRAPGQLGKKGLSNHRWIAGGKLCAIVNQRGRIVAWTCDTANVHDSAFHPLIARFADRTVVLADGNFHRAAGNPANLLVCGRGTWPQRILVETVFSLLTRVCHLKHAAHRTWAAFQARLAFTVAVFNLLADWAGPRADGRATTHLSIAEFAL